MLSKEIRELLKKEGFKRTDISVRNVRCTTDTIIRVEIKNPYINRQQVDDLLKHFNDVGIDERTGEILSGGNTFVSVEWQYGIFDEVKKEFLEFAENVLSTKETYVEFLPGLWLYREYKFNEFNKFEIRQSNKTGYKKVNNADDLAVYIFKYKNLGDIFA